MMTGFDTLPQARAIPDPLGAPYALWEATAEFDIDGVRYSQQVQARVDTYVVPGPLYVQQIRDEVSHQVRLVDAAGVVRGCSARALPVSAPPDAEPVITTESDVEYFADWVRVELPKRGLTVLIFSAAGDEELARQIAELDQDSNPPHLADDDRP